jgi:hypothetical protein
MAVIVSCPKLNCYLEGSYAGVPPCEDINGKSICDCSDKCTREFTCTECDQKCGERNDILQSTER